MLIEASIELSPAELELARAQLDGMVKAVHRGRDAAHGNRRPGSVEPAPDEYPGR